MKKRTQARGIALQILYQLDLRGGDALEDLDAFLAESDADGGVRDDARALALAAWERRAALDAELAAAAEHWDLRRMAAVDRNILRLGAHELLHCPDVPPPVAIDEAVELAKKFSTAQSGAFVNGVLDKIRTRVQRA
jgi:transcription antitermination factor NusB